MSKNKPTIGLFTTVEGHFSIAEAIQQMFSHDYDVQLFFARDDLMAMYLPFYKFFPFFFTIPMQLGRSEKIMDISNNYLKRKYRIKVNAFCERNHPQILINTYLAYNTCLSEVAEQKQIPFINVLADPRTIHPLIVAAGADINISFDDRAKISYRKDFAQAKVQPMGWFVRQEYEQDYDQAKVRAGLGLDKDTLTFLVASGSEGTNLVATILPTLLSAKKPLHILVACGNNKTMFKSIKLLSKHLPMNSDHISIQPIGFTNELYLYMQAADLVVGKAGPNTVFEAAATLTPFLAMTHITGQEDGNLDIIREYGLGYVEENVFKANRLLSKIIKHPEGLDKFQPSLKKMADYNKNAKKQLSALVKNLLI